MTKASDNEFPSILFDEQGSDVTTPASGFWRLYTKSTGLFLRDDAGTVTGPFGTGGGGGAADAHGCRIKRSSGDTSIGNNVLTVIPFNSEDYDTDTMHDNSTDPSRVVIPTISGVTTGMWLMVASGYASVSGRCDAMFRKNAAGNPASGTALAFDAHTIGTALTSFMITTTAVMSSGDYVEVFVRSSGGSGTQVFEADISPIMQVSFLGKVT